MGEARRIWRRAPLEPEAAAAVVDATVELNRRRLRIMAPFMVLVHLAHVWHFYIPDATRARLTASEQRWRDGLVVDHLIWAAIAAVIALTARFAPRRVVRWLGPIGVTAYLVHGAVTASIDQIVVANLTAYVGYCFAMALFFALTPVEAVIAYAIGVTALIVGFSTVAESAAAFGTNLPTALTTTVVSVIMSWIASDARRRDVLNKRIIARQAAELAALNAGLERRVAEQVDEIVARAAQIERLNAELQAQVRARSAELSQTLQRLARQMQTSRGLAPGAVVGERFVIEAPIGEGGMGVVYAGLDRSTGARVAIKIIQATSTHQLDALRRFIREAGATAAVRHAAVVRIVAHDVTDDGLLFQVQELVEGEPLSKRLSFAWTPGDAARLAAVLADALAAAHAEGVIHRDVKPENLMLTRTPPGLKLLDFGIAKLHDVVLAQEQTLEATMLGTPAYMAPEQVAADGVVDDRADLYAVGVILHQLVTTRLPVEAATGRELMARKLTAAPPDLNEAGVPPAFASLVARCLAIEPAARPSAAELAIGMAAIADEIGAMPLEAQLDSTSSTPIPTVVERRGGPARR